MSSELNSSSIPASSPNPHTGEGASSYSGFRIASRTAVLLDGGFVRKRFAELAKRRISVGEIRPLADGLLDPPSEILFRIYFYDCAPSENTTTHPITGKPLSLKTTRSYQENASFQEALAKTEQIARGAGGRELHDSS